MNQTNRRSGILLHPTSFPNAYGIGDLGKSAYDFINFLKTAGQTLWQTLPLGPTGYGDSPYQSFSAFAGNPLLISPDILMEKGYLSTEDIHSLSSSATEKVDYGTLIPQKMAVLQKAATAFFADKASLSYQKFTAFCLEESFWLEDYALFVALKSFFIESRKSQGFSPQWENFCKSTPFLSESLQKDYYFGAVWSTWPKELASRNKNALRQWRLLLQDEILFQYFLQFEFRNQWFDLKKYANKNNIQIIGDIPIFVAYDSADTWANQEIFYLDKNGYPSVVAGVPPDYFSQTGQLWGNPLYRWDVLSKNNYHWWISRIKSALRLSDIIRIDHFRGFESYWATPFGEDTAIHGTWEKASGKEFFLALKKQLGDLPIIAEDLGIITEEVTKLRQDLSFPGMKVLQFAFGTSFNQDYLPHMCESSSVIYTGTHDNDTTKGWYQSATPQEQDHFRRYMNVSGENASWDMIRLASSSPCMYAIFPLQDVLSLGSEARMNTPGTPWGNWQFRYQKEQLTPQLAQSLLYITQLFGRVPDEDAFRILE